MIGVELLTIEIGHPRYEEIMRPIRQNVRLRQQMWDDAEHAFDEEPGKSWCMVLCNGIPAAWAASTCPPSRLLCCDNYERRGSGRQYGLYRLAYDFRHATIVAPSTLPAITYLGAEPIPLHEADGWVKTGTHGVSSSTGLEWWQLHREPTAH